MSIYLPFIALLTWFVHCLQSCPLLVVKPYQTSLNGSKCKIDVQNSFFFLVFKTIFFPGNNLAFCFHIYVMVALFFRASSHLKSIFCVHIFLSVFHNSSYCRLISVSFVLLAGWLVPILFGQKKQNKTMLLMWIENSLVWIIFLSSPCLFSVSESILFLFFHVCYIFPSVFVFYNVLRLSFK